MMKEKRKLILYYERGLIGFYSEREDFVLIYVILNEIEIGDGFKLSWEKVFI